jgi:hypothetical protein
MITRLESFDGDKSQGGLSAKGEKNKKSLLF